MQIAILSPMDSRSALATIARQVEAARILAGFDGRRRDPSGIVPAVLRTLRVTYLALSAGLDPGQDASHLFVLRVSSTGDHTLTQGGRSVRVNAPYLAYLFWTAGVDLLPGQILFLEPDLAKDAVEEALGLLALEQACLERERMRRRDDAEALRRLWDRKIELLAASLLADEYLERTRALAESEEAA
jgi:hypothetical protein